MNEILLLLNDPAVWASLLTLTAMEIVLGIDNIIFIAILASRLPPAQQAAARQVGLALALGSRLGLLAAITWIMRLTDPLFTVLDQPFSGRDLILIGGGLFLIYKGTVEIHDRIESTADGGQKPPEPKGFFSTVLQIMVIDIVFSLDSVITAVGMANDIWIMVTAVVISVGVMLVAAGPLAEFVGRHPTVKMLALSFLLLIGMTLMSEGFGVHVSKGYIYAAMAFSALVESLNLLTGRRGGKRSPH